MIFKNLFLYPIAAIATLLLLIVLPFGSACSMVQKTAGTDSVASKEPPPEVVLDDEKSNLPKPKSVQVPPQREVEVANAESSKPDSPVIRYLTATKQLLPNKGTEVFCVATNNKGGPLKYEWSASGGDIKPGQEPDTINWFAPDQTGSYIITVKVTNELGVSSTESVSIMVSKEREHYPIIYGVNCTNCMNTTEASRFSKYTLKCEAVDPDGDELKYTWFANIGRINGDGPVVEWSTGNPYGSALITVIVSDNKGNEIEGYLGINISCCK